MDAECRYREIAWFGDPEYSALKGKYFSHKI